ADGRADAPAQLEHVALTVRVDATGENDLVALACGVQPDRGAGESRVARGADGEEGPEGARIRGGHVPAEPPRRLADGLGREHGAHGRRLEIAPAVQRATREQHPTESREVI